MMAQRLVAALGGDRREAGTARDLGGQPQLHRIVVHDENARHQVSQAFLIREAEPRAESRCAVSEQDEKCGLRGA